jgi:asparagine synthase (glutamine-hydrolysing)
VAGLLSGPGAGIMAALPNTSEGAMCGITGILTRDHHDVVGAMTAALSHRGPDGDGFFRDSSVALGHRRLSIIDVAGGSQPIANEDGTIQMVSNGEIFNSPRLRQQLEAAGHVFRTHTDVETILHLYEDHGPDCVKHLRGQFAFAIWDSVRRRLMLARDHMGQKPLFFAQVGDQLLFASEVKALLASGLVDRRPDLNALWHYVSLRFIPDRYSLFEGIQKLPAASRLIWQDGKVEIDKYWSFNFDDKLDASESEVADHLEELLLETVQMHMLSDVPVGAFLSGGIDSSLIAAMMSRVASDPISTFSIGVEEQDYNELPYARMVNEQYGLVANERIVKADLIHLMPRMVYHLDEPSDPFGVGVYLVSEVAAEQVKVVLSGDGGDENFAGYDRFAGQRLVDLYCLLPDFLRRHVMRRLFDLVPESFGYKSLAQKLTWVNEMSFFDNGARYAHAMSFLRFTPEAKAQLFTSEARDQIDDGDSVAKILRWFDADGVDDVVDRMLYTDLNTRMPDHLLPIVDRMSMAHSLESRPPLIDHKVVEFAASIPGAMKLQGRNLKHILKVVAARYLPSELIHREKQGFGFPLGRWMRTDLQPFIRNLFAESRFIDQGIFDAGHVHGIIDEHMAGGVNHEYRLWILINLEFWHRLYFENASVDSLLDLTDRLSSDKPCGSARATA